MNHKDHTVLVLDSGGLFVSIAERLARDFGKVYFFSEYAGAFPRDAEVAIGHGLPGVTRCYDIYLEVLDKVNKDDLLILVTDVFSPGLTEHLRKQGYRVWGAGYGEFLETDRLKAKEVMLECGLNVGPFEHLIGIDALEKYLKRAEDVFVKARYARIRGNFETKHFLCWDLMESWLSEVRGKLGRRAETTEFIVEKSIPDAVEISCDRYCIGGNFSEGATMGIEVKGDGYLSQFFEDFPSQITDFDCLLQNKSWSDDYRQFFTVETRVDQNMEPWGIDPACRTGRPCWGTQLTMFENIADIYWFGAQGVLVNPKPKDECCAEMMIECTRVEKYGCVLDYPDSIVPYVFMSDMCLTKGKRMVIPADISNIGSVVGTGSTMDEAIKVCLERGKLIKGDGVLIHPEWAEKAKADWEKLA